LEKRRINIGLAAYGLSGQVFHAPYLKDDMYNVVSILERTKEISREMFPQAKIVRNYRNLLKDTRIEMIVVNTPDALHYPMAKDALSAGKHVIVEKPVCRNIKEFRELSHLAEERGLFISAYQNKRFESDFLTVKKLLHEKRLGKLVKFESRFDRYRPEIKDTWREKESIYNSILYNIGPHLIDQVIHLFGRPLEVNAFLRKIRPGSRVYDFMEMQLLYSDLFVSLGSAYMILDAPPRFRIDGMLGSYVKYGRDPYELRFKRKYSFDVDVSDDTKCNKGVLTYIKNGIPMKEDVIQVKGGYGLFYEGVFNCIRNNQPHPVPIEDTLLSMEIIEKAVQSHKNKRAVAL